MNNTTVKDIFRDLSPRTLARLSVQLDSLITRQTVVTEFKAIHKLSAMAYDTGEIRLGGDKWASEYLEAVIWAKENERQ